MKNQVGNLYKTPYRTTNITSLDWQVHVYGEAASGMSEVCGRRGLALHSFPWQSATSRAGLKRGAVYLVRPDGYVGLADPDANPASVERYLDTRCARPMAFGDRRGCR
jgi:hypothetical protein